MEIWQNLEKKRNTDYDFPPHYMWAENNKKLTGQNIFRPELFSRRFSVFAEIWGKLSNISLLEQVITRFAIRTLL